MKKNKQKINTEKENVVAPIIAPEVKGTMEDYFAKYYKAYKNDYVSQYYKAYKELKEQQRQDKA